MAINSFQTIVFLLYPLKAWKNQRFSAVFRGYAKRLKTWNGLAENYTSSYFFCSRVALVNLQEINYIN